MPSALVLIDAQWDMFDPAAPADGADLLLERLQGLLRRARAAAAPVVLIRNRGRSGDPDEPGLPGFEFHPDLQPGPGELVLDKTTADAFASTDLASALAARGVDRIVVAGLQSEYCVRETVLGALNHGLRVVLVADGHSTYASGGRTAEAIRTDVNTELAWRVALEAADSVTFTPAGG